MNRNDLNEFSKPIHSAVNGPGSVSIRAGGAAKFTLKVSYGLFDELIHSVVNAPVNKDIFMGHKYKV